MVICLERAADLHTAQLMPLSLTVTCFSKTDIGSTFLVPAHPGSPGQRAVRRLYVCVCVYVMFSNHEGYTQLNHVPSTETILSVIAYENVDANSPSSSRRDPASDGGGGSDHPKPPHHDSAGDSAKPVSTRVVRELDGPRGSSHSNVGVVVPMKWMGGRAEDDDLDAGGYLTLVPSTEDLSKVDQPTDITRAAENTKSAGGDDGLDGNGYLVLHHVSTPKSDRKPDTVGGSSQKCGESKGVSAVPPQTAQGVSAVPPQTAQPGREEYA